MRFNFRLKFGNLTLFALIAKTQTLEGVTSLQTDGSHTIMWDLENCTLQEAEKTLKEIQRKYRLSHIYVTSDVEGSYRAWCFSKVHLKTFLHILLDTDQLDPNFFYYTVKRQKATLRAGSKRGRPARKVVSVLKSYPVPIPTSGTLVERVVYDTGLEKRGISLLIGDD